MTWTKESFQVVLDDIFINKVPDVASYAGLHFSKDYREYSSAGERDFNGFVQMVIQLRDATKPGGTITVHQCFQVGREVATRYTVDVELLDGNAMKVEAYIIGETEEDGHRFLNLWEATVSI